MPTSTSTIPYVPRAPAPSSEQARRVMLGNRSESEVERQLRSVLHRRGLRFRKHLAPLRGLRCRPDIVFTRQRIAVFVDGCFWHRCPEHGTDPKANGDWWRLKLDANAARDKRNNKALTDAGWLVLRFWAHQPIAEMSETIVAAHASRDNDRSKATGPMREP
jgi:DNA mismatch endonuclease, patch repair protein